MAANLQHLRAFHAVAGEGSIVRAARRLAVSQPTISEQLRALEDGIRIRCLPTAFRGVGVDTPADLARAEALLPPGDFFVDASPKVR